MFDKYGKAIKLDNIDVSKKKKTLREDETFLCSECKNGISFTIIWTMNTLPM